ncbi:MAG: OmpA family protein [Janthinobacterium lividum]
MKYRSTVALGAAGALALSGCAINSQTGNPEIAPSVNAKFHSIFASDDPCSNNDRNIGIAAGAVAGSVIGYLAHGTKGAIAGAVIGGGGGFLIGHLMDNRRCDLYKIAQQNGLKLASTKITSEKLGTATSQSDKHQDDSTLGLDVQLQNEADEFAPGTAQLTPRARRYFGQIAAQYAPKQLLSALPASSSAAQRQAALSHKVFIVGHTDERDSGSQEDLAALSEARAKSIARIFVDAGVDANNLYYQGAGDTLPIANNTTTEGRQENQRVEIVDVPTEADLSRFLARRSADPANYRAVNAGDLALPTTSAQVADDSNGEADTAVPSHSPTHRRAATKTKIASKNTASVATASTAATPTPEDTTQASVGTHGSANDSVAAIAPDAAATTPIRARTVKTGYDFGGQPTQGNGVPVQLGASVNHSMFSFISEANADTRVTLGSCRGDRPHRGSSIRNLGTGASLDVKESVPGFFGMPWAGTLNKHYIAVLNASVPVDAGSPIPEPELLIYKDYNGDSKQKPSYSAHEPVNVYRGSAATLYRIFVNGPMQCLDMIVPISSRQATTHVYYTNNTVNYTASGGFTLQQR